MIIGNRRVIRKGKLYVEYEPGRKLYKETYIGPDKPYAGDGPEFWAVPSGWWLKRGDGVVFSKAFIRVGFGKAYCIFRFFPLIFIFDRYTRKYSFRLRWN